MKIYGPDDITSACRMIGGLVPSGVRVMASVVNAGVTLKVLVQSGIDLATYEFGWTGRSATSPGKPAPVFGRAAANIIADEWETGRHLPVANRADNHANHAAPEWVRSRQELTGWLVGSKNNNVAVVYFAGNLADYRAKAHKRLVEINRIEDKGSGRMPLRASLRRERAQIERVQELLQTIDKLYKNGTITLSQRRAGTETHYLATKVKNIMPSNPVVVMALQKQVRNAIQRHWGQYAGEADGFKILAIGFEGGHDEIHNMTAKVEVYNRNPQNPLHFRIPTVDLGTDADQWGPMLAQRAAAVKKQLRAREGRSATTKKTLDDLA